MKFFPRSAWRYAVLIILLFAIVATASRFIIVYLHEQLPEPQYEQLASELSIAIWALTMGFMFLAGALGLWAIRSTVEIEGRRRIGRFVDTMDYLSDGLLVLDRSGRITGSNPAARQMAPRVIPENVPVTLQDAFPCLMEQDMNLLLDFKQPLEIERNGAYPHGLRTLRFRSQPSEGIMLVLVSDVTDMRSQEIRQKQIAQLQLVGRIANGVARDFNNILCAISGHAALLNRFEQDPAAMRRSVDIIRDEIRKGSRLSQQLLELSRSGGSGNPSDRLSQDVEDAAALLRVALSPAWTVKTMIEGQYPAVPLTSTQIEQVVLNLGLLAADAQPTPGVIMITLHKPGPGHLLEVGDQFAAVIIISGEVPMAEVGINGTKGMKKVLAGDDETGVILSVVQSLVEEAHGRMDRLIAPGGLCVYRVCLPHLDVRVEKRETVVFPRDELDGYISGWQVLLADPSREMDQFKKYLHRLGTTIIERDNVVSLLADVESFQKLDAIVLDKRLLGPEADGLLKAILKLCPKVGVVALCQDPKQESSRLHSTMVFVPHGASSERMIQAMVDAKTLVHTRGAKTQA